LRQTKNSVRINTLDANTAEDYPRHIDDQGFPVEDDRFIENSIAVKAIATSGGQNDSGVFELSFRDERYLPFEGAGVISEWSLELFSDLPSNNPDPAHPDFGRPLRQFDYETISDVIVHTKYTAREAPDTFKGSAVGHLREYFGQDQPSPSLRMLNLRQEFPTQWYRFLNPANPADGNVFEFDMSTDLFNYRDHDKTLKINRITLLARCINDDPYTVVLDPPLSAGSDTFNLAQEPQLGGLHLAQTPDGADLGIEIAPTNLPVKWKLKMTRPIPGNLGTDPKEVEDLLIILAYEWT
jgi:hypothetical protein